VIVPADAEGGGGGGSIVRTALSGAGRCIGGGPCFEKVGCCVTDGEGDGESMVAMLGTFGVAEGVRGCCGGGKEKPLNPSIPGDEGE